MQLHEVHRFRTPLIEIGGHLHWDIDELWQDVRLGLDRALTFAPDLRSISVDSWAVDYVDLDASGAPLHHPFAYRDARTRGRLADVFRRMPAAEVYALTGTQFLPFNTLSQVVADLSDDPVGTGRVAHRLLIADYLLYRLSGRLVAERTMASTTQLFDITRMEWADLVDSRDRRRPRAIPGGRRAGHGARPFADRCRRRAGDASRDHRDLFPRHGGCGRGGAGDGNGNVGLYQFRHLVAGGCRAPAPNAHG